MSELEQLRAAVEELRDIEALKRLKATYCHIIDAGRWDELYDLFTEDASFDYGFFGSYEGRDQVVNTFFRQLVSAASSFSAHMVHNPVIDVDGDSASAKWYLTAQTTNQPSNRAVWVMGIYDDRFRREGGGWKISSLKFEFHYFTPFDEGWAKIPIWEPPS
ncbi:MAG: nuclear transport factor 2 family protein [Planctomycetota bacterium]|jgi:hypothetical protein